MDGLRAVLQIRGKLAFRPPCGSPVTVIVMRAWLAVTGVPPVVHCSKTGLSDVALSATEGKLVYDTGLCSRKWSQEQIHAWRVL